MSTGTKAWVWLAAFAMVLAALLFASAGTVHYWQGWVFLAVTVGAAAATTADLTKRDPALLERRLRGGPTAEKRPAQRIVMTFLSACYLALIVVPPLGHRFGWAPTGAVVSIVGDVLAAIGFLGIYFVYRENSFAAATIGLAAGQKVVSTGPYALVRHPMYAGGLVYLAGTPLALGSWWGLAPLAAMLPFLIWRLLDEESFLAAHLTGYRGYMSRVRWRLAPGIF